MKLKILAFVTIAAMSIINPAYAAVGYYSGQEMLSDCESESDIDNIACLTYLSGISDAHDGLYEWNSLGTKYFCSPESVDVVHLQKVFIKYAKENPQSLILDMTAASMALNAFAKAFPCE